MLFILFILGFFTGCMVMIAGIILAVIDPRTAKELTKEKWKRGYRQR